MARILMAAYTNFRRDPRVRREAEALVEAGHSVVFLARRQPDEVDRETLCGVDVIKLPGLTHDRSSILGYLLDYAIFFVLLSLHLTLRPRRYRLIHINNMELGSSSRRRRAGPSRGRYVQMVTIPARSLTKSRTFNALRRPDGSCDPRSSGPNPSGRTEQQAPRSEREGTGIGRRSDP